jgi:hypothetical protein
MKGTYLKTSLLWSAMFGALEAAFFTRANDAYPVGWSHLLLALLFALVFAAVALLAGGLAAWVRRGRDGASSLLAHLAGPWSLLVILAVTVYRERINTRPGNWQGLLGSLVTFLLMALLLAAAHRLLRDRPQAGGLGLAGLGWLGLAWGLVWLWTARPVTPPSGTTSTSPASSPSAVAGPGAPGIDATVHDTGLRVLLVGFDGGTWKIYDPLLRKGLLPAHADLIRRGVTADLKVFLPSYTPPMWTSIASSRSVAEHGIHDHIRTALPLGLPTVPHQVKHFRFLTKAARVATRAVEKAFGFRPVFALYQDVFVRRLWDILGERGVPTILVDWIVTYPAQPIPGIMVSDHLHLHGAGTSRMPGLVSPDSLTARFQDLVVTPEKLPDSCLFDLLDVTDLGAGGRAELRHEFSTWFTVIGKDMARDLSTAAIAQEAFPLVPDWRFAGIYFRAMDNAHHLTWHLKDLPAEELDLHPERRLRTAIDRMYEHCDRLLADLLQFADDRTVVIVMSDHGFENARYHHSRAPDGFFIMAGGPVRQLPVRQQIHVYDITPTVLALLGWPVAADMRGRVAESFIDSAFWERYPVRTIPTYETGPRVVEEAPTLEMDAKTIQHLRALGYVD